GAHTETSILALHDALPISRPRTRRHAYGAASRPRLRCSIGYESEERGTAGSIGDVERGQIESLRARSRQESGQLRAPDPAGIHRDRKSTRLNSSHVEISYD